MDSVFITFWIQISSFFSPQNYLEMDTLLDADREHSIRNEPQHHASSTSGHKDACMPGCSTIQYCNYSLICMRYTTGKFTWCASRIRGAGCRSWWAGRPGYRLWLTAGTERWAHRADELGPSHCWRVCTPAQHHLISVCHILLHLLKGAVLAHGF